MNKERRLPKIIVVLILSALSIAGILFGSLLVCLKMILGTFFIVCGLGHYSSFILAGETFKFSGFVALAIIFFTLATIIGAATIATQCFCLEKEKQKGEKG